MQKKRMPKVLNKLATDPREGREKIALSLCWMLGKNKNLEFETNTKTIV